MSEPLIKVKVYCATCEGRGGYYHDCEALECSDSTWEHYRTAGYQNCRACHGTPLQARISRLQDIFEEILRTCSQED